MKKYSALVLCLAISACGFTPLYYHTNTPAGAASVLDDVWIDTIPDAEGLELRNALVDRFYHHGTPDNPAYVLHITLTQNARDLAIKKDATTTRAQLVFRADYTLLRRDTRAVVDSGSTRAIGSYNILSSQYTTIVTQSAARTQALQELADKLALRTGVVLQGSTHTSE